MKVWKAIAALVLLSSCATAGPSTPYADCEARCHRAFKRCRALEPQVSQQLACGDQYAECLAAECGVPYADQVLP